MGTPAKSKASIRSSNKTKHTRDKVQSNNTEYKILSKKDNEKLNLAQKPKEKVRETRQTPNKNVSLTRKLNNINDFLMKETKNLKEQNRNTFKISADENTSSTTEGKSIWHNILSRKNAKTSVKQNTSESELDLSSESIELEDEQTKSEANVSEINIEENKILTNKAIKTLSEEFQNIFESLKKNASSKEKKFLDIKRKRLEMIYYGIASLVPANEIYKLDLLQTANENSKSDTESINVIQGAKIENDVVLLIPENAHTKAIDSLQNLLYKSAKDCYGFKKIQEANREAQENDAEENKNEQFEKKNANDEHLSALKSDLLAIESSQLLPEEEENISEENYFEEMNFEIEGFQSSADNSNENIWGIEDVQIENDESERSTISFKVDVEVKIKNNDLNIGTVSRSDSKVDINELRYSKSEEVKRLEFNTQNDNKSQSTLSSVNSSLEKDEEKNLEELKEAAVNAENKQFETEKTIAGFSQILLTELQTKPIYQNKDLSQSQQTIWSEWSIFNEVEKQQAFKNLHSDKNIVEKEILKNFGADCKNIESSSNNSVEYTTSNLTSEKTSDNNEVNLETLSISKLDIIATILKELKGEASEISISKSDFNNDVLLRISSMNTSINESSVEANEVENALLNCQTPNENLSVKSSQLLQTSNQYMNIERPLKENEQIEMPEFTAENCIKDFLKKISKSYEISTSEQTSMEKLDSEKNTTEEDYTTEQQNACAAKEIIEVCYEKSDTQLLIEQLENNLEQIRIGLTELGEQCDNEEKKVPRQRPRFLPSPERKRSFIRNAEIEMNVNHMPKLCYDNLEESLEPGLTNKCSCLNSNPTTLCRRQTESFENEAQSNETSKRKHVTWTKVHDFEKQASRHINTNEIHLSNQFNAITCNQTKPSINEISQPISIKISEVELHLRNKQHLNTSINKQEDTQNIDSLQTNNKNKCFDKKKVLKVPRFLEKEAKIQVVKKSTRNAETEIPTYTGCSCMFKTYETILKQIQDTKQQF